MIYYHIVNADNSYVSNDFEAFMLKIYLIEGIFDVSTWQQRLQPQLETTPNQLTPSSTCLWRSIGCLVCLFSPCWLVRYVYLFTNWFIHFQNTHYWLADSFKFCRLVCFDMSCVCIPLDSLWLNSADWSVLIWAAYVFR